MQFTKIALAVAATLVAGQAAAAVTPTDIANARAAGTLQETWLSGASAPTFNIYEGFALGCDAGSMSLYNSGSSTTAVKPGSTGNFNAYACTRGGVVSVMYHTLDGGSFNAYAPHVPNDVDGNGIFGVTSLKRLKAIDNNGTCALIAATFNGIPVYRSCTTVTPTAANVLTEVTPALKPTALPAGGFSDVEAALWGVSVAAHGTEAQANVGQVFGLAVSTNLYRELQVAQGIYASVAAAGDADPSFDPANAPNITSAQYASMAAQGSGYQVDWSPILGAAGVSKAVNVARRVATSGTQASSNAFFMRNPCSGATGVGGSLFPAAIADSIPGAFVVTEGSSTGNVKTNLTTANTNGEFAIGVVSLENDWRVETGITNNQYRFVKVDGVHPEAGSWDGVTTNSNGTPFYTARTTALNGDYAFHMEMVSFVANTADTFGASLIPAIASALGNPGNCTDVPRGLTLNPLGGSTCNYPGQPGASAGGSITDAEALTQPEVAKHTRFGNNCQATQLFF